MIFNPKPENVFKKLSQGCDRNCKFQQLGPSTVTAMYFAPVYDKEGNNLNPDGNIRSSSYQCTECGKSWRVSEQYGQSSVLLLNEEKPASYQSLNETIISGDGLVDVSNTAIAFSNGTGFTNSVQDIEYLKDHY
jgi:hypothetical protein